jgi:hypothetical protein
MTTSARDVTEQLDPERVAYWYFRLNGFLQIENFVVHPPGKGGQRTDADLLAVRFPHRAERLIDNPDDIMADDTRALVLCPDELDVAIVEVKTNQPCTLNGPWTRPNRQNVERVLAAIGCLPPDEIGLAAADIYRAGIHRDGRGLRIRLIAIGWGRSEELTARFPAVVQLTWTDILGFIWRRFDAYRRQKTQVEQWDDQGKRLKRLADNEMDPTAFVDNALRLMGVRSID